MELILASTSSTRSWLLDLSGIAHTAIASNIDEQMIKKSMIADNAPARDIADTLAEFKARKVSTKYPDALVLGCDQIAEFGGDILSKPTSQKELVDRFLKYAGQRHHLYTAQVIYKAGEPIWRFVARSDLTFQSFTEQEFEEIVNQHWPSFQHSAAGYFFEETPHLFATVKGNWYDILGLSLIPLLNHFRLNDDIKVPTQDPKLAAVLGDPIAQSKSPRIHRHWLSKFNIPGDYIRVRVPDAHFDTAVRNMVSAGFAGFNVTIPNKLNAKDFSDELDPSADRIGAVNTLQVRPDKTIFGSNTDGFGFMAHLTQTLPDFSVSGKTALILGAGGAALAVIDALISDGVEKIWLTNRSKSKVLSLVDKYPGKIVPIDWNERTTPVSDSQLIVNTTSLGMMGMPELDFDLAALSPGTVVYDLVYNPLETNLLKAAKAQGGLAVDGLGMLLHQARPGFSHWFGKMPDVTEDLQKIVLE